MLPPIDFPDGFAYAEHKSAACFMGENAGRFFTQEGFYTNEKRNCYNQSDHRGRDLETTFIVLFSHCSGNIFSAAVQHGRYDRCRAFCQQRSSCRRRWFRRTDCRSDRGILRRTGFRCFGYHFPVLRCQRQSTAEPCPAYCLCILYHWKYFHHRSGNSDRSLDA